MYKNYRACSKKTVYYRIRGKIVFCPKAIAKAIWD